MIYPFFFYMLLAATPSNPIDVPNVLDAFGITPVKPAVDAPDFQLPDLSGKTVSLSTHHGRWVVLTFWATWCGPCRSEMPSLQALFQQLDQAKATILGVAIGSEPEQVKNFVATHNLTFPVVIDNGDRVARLYKATGVPVSFFIDPSGKIAGVARGARDWSKTLPLMQTLSGAAVPDNQETNNYSQEPLQSLNLPQQLTPPTAEINNPTGAIEPGDEFAIEVQIHWAGHIRDYLLLPPSVHLPEGIQQHNIEASSNSQSGNQMVTYKLRLRAEKEGTFNLDPVEIRYTPHLEGKPLTQRIQGPRIVVQKASMYHRSYFWLILGSGILLLAAGATIILYRKKRNPTNQPNNLPDHIHWNLTLQELHSLRVSGDVAGFLAMAAKLAQTLKLEELLENQKLYKLTSMVRYGNHIPEDRELDRIQRQLELWIKDKTGKRDILAEEKIRLVDR